MKYQIVVEVAEGTEMENLPNVFVGMTQALGINRASQKQMPGTRIFNGKMLLHMEINNITASAEFMGLITAGIQVQLGASWVIKHAQGDDLPPDIQMAESYFLDFMSDIDEERPTVAVAHQFAGNAELALG